MNIIKYNKPKDNGNGSSNMSQNPFAGYGSSIATQELIAQVQEQIQWKKGNAPYSIVPKYSNIVTEGESSVAMGVNTRTSNTGEFALGVLNKTTVDSTMFSIGDGTDEDHRHNIFEIDKNGNTTMTGVMQASKVVAPTGEIDTLISDDITTDELNVTLSAFIKSLLAEDITVDNLTVNKAAHFFKLIIDEVKASKGQIIVTPSNAVIDLVEPITGGYRCYFRATDGEKEILNSFEVNDQILCQTFNAAQGTSYNVSNKFYWRLCTAVANAPVEKEINDSVSSCWYIDLSDTDKDQYSNGIPEVGDEIVMLGNRTDTTRQAAIVISAYNNTYLDGEINAPAIVQYDGINNYILRSHRLNVISKGLNSFKGTFVTSGGDNIEDLIEDIDTNETYVHMAWANSSDGSVDFTKTNNDGDYAYVGFKSDTIQSDASLVYTDYTWNQIKGENGDDADYYKLSPINENFTLLTDTNGTIYIYLGYNILHIVGQSISTVMPNQNGYHIKFSTNVAPSQYYSFGTGSAISTYQNTRFQTNYYTQENKITSITVFLVDANDNVIDRRYLPLVIQPNAILKVDADLNTISATVAGHSEDITEMSSSVSELTINYNSISATVTQISNDYVTSSQLLQTANNIQLNVYNELNVKTGIDVANGKITLNADNTDITGNLNLRDPRQGLVIYDNYNNPKVTIQNEEIGNFSAFDFGSDLTVRDFYYNVVEDSNVVTVTFPAKSLGTLTAGQQIKIEQPHVLPYKSDNISGSTLASLTYTYEIKLGSLTKQTVTGANPTKDGNNGYPMTPLTYTTDAAGEYTFNLTIRYSVSNSDLYGQWINYYWFYFSTIQSNLNKIGTDGAVFSSDQRKYSWFGNDQILMAHGTSDLENGALKIQNGKIMRKYNPDKSSGAATNYFVDISTSTPYVITSGTWDGEKYTYNATVDDGLIVFDNGGAWSLVILPEPWTCPGKIIEVKSLGGREISVWRQNNIIGPNGGVSDIYNSHYTYNTLKVISLGSRGWLVITYMDWNYS